MNQDTLTLILQGVQIASAAAEGAPRAIAAVDMMKRIKAEGRDPTAAEWAEINETTDALHDRLQAAAGRGDSGA